MPLKQHIISNQCPYHVSVRTNNAEWFGLPMREVWDLFSDYLYFISVAYDVKIHSFVLMSNHFHLLISTPKANLSQAMGYMLREVSKEISRSQKRMNHNFKSRYFRSLILSEHHYMNVYKYVYRNPIEANIVSNVEHYRFSTLAGLLGFQKMHIPLIEDPLLDSYKIQCTLNWLNLKPVEEDKIVMRRALKKSSFAIGNDRFSNKQHRLETHLY